MKELAEEISNKYRHNYAVIVVFVAGIATRVSYWQLYPPKWTLHAVFNPIQFGFIKYVSNFEGYHPLASPFYDSFAAAFYIPFSGLFGFRALILFNLVVSVLSIPIFYSAVRRLFSRQAALFALLFFALFPKISQLTGVGFEEGAAIGLVAIAFYGVVRAAESDAVGWYGLAGVLCLLSVAVFTPALGFVIVALAYLYMVRFSNRDYNNFNIHNFTPDLKIWVFILPTLVWELLYFRYGPISNILTGTDSYSGTVTKSPALFTDPAAYSLPEIALRFLAYSHFDFWWHRSGFDHESSIMSLINGLDVFLGEWFGIYFVGWSVITMALTLGIVYGAYCLASDWSPSGAFVSLWLGGYIIGHIVVLVGIRDFQFRQMAPVFPAISIAFGVGMDAITDRMRPWISHITPSQMELRVDQLLAGLTAIGLIVLVINGAVHGEIRGEKYEIGRQQPAEKLQEIVNENESVGVIQDRLYRSTILYTENKVRPIILKPDKSNIDRHMAPFADIRVVRPTELNHSGISYLYLKNTVCGDTAPSDVYQKYRDAAMQNGKVVYENEMNRGAFRCSRINVRVVRL